MDRITVSVGVRQSRRVLRSGFQVAVTRGIVYQGICPVRPGRDKADAGAGEVRVRGEIGEVARGEGRVRRTGVNAVVEIADKQGLERRVRRVAVAVDLEGRPIKVCM